ncbi:hypothetical protein ACFSTE_13800 [Aquimarina hainanensis]|uniref:Uncharacterized protein n=2 Tax=Aquimarina hainanensis TaxID=1578017 RepID=A0ABW5N9S9_9FLAO|nr:hypothetical protein [Aquimarina sp. TRL1]QKX04041.1 hypothetical protein HN014_03680 [Aquimarina sp. TRL1]
MKKHQHTNIEMDSSKILLVVATEGALDMSGCDFIVTPSLQQLTQTRSNKKVKNTLLSVETYFQSWVIGERYMDVKAAIS